MTTPFSPEDHLAALAAQWWAASDTERPHIQHAYARRLEALYAQGWDEVIDLQERLPDEAMPESFFVRHPECRGMQLWKPSPLSKQVTEVDDAAIPAYLRDRVHGVMPAGDTES